MAAQTTEIMDMVDVDTAERMLAVCWQRLYPPPQSLGCRMRALLPTCSIQMRDASALLKLFSQRNPLAHFLMIPLLNAREQVYGKPSRSSAGL